MDQEPLDAATWRERCARRITDLDDQVSEDEAKEIAEEVRSFERTGAMQPEAAAEFVVSEMSRPGRGRFERRSRSRAARRPIFRSIARFFRAMRGGDPE